MTKLLPRRRYDETSIVGPSIDHTNFRLTFLNVECWACAWKLRNGVYEALRDTFSGALLAWSGSKRKFTFGWSGFMCLCFFGWKLIVARYHKIFFGMLSACAILLKATISKLCGHPSEGKVSNRLRCKIAVVRKERFQLTWPPRGCLVNLGQHDDYSMLLKHFVGEAGTRKSL